MRHLFALIALSALLGCDAEQGNDPTVIAYIPDRSAPNCAVTRIVDGDTVTLHCLDGLTGNVRLVGYDTPETFRPRCIEEKALGLTATDYLEYRLKRAERVRIVHEGTDKYRRPLVRMWVDDTALSEIMVSKGLAKPYSGRTKRPDWCAILLT